MAEKQNPSPEGGRKTNFEIVPKPEFAATGFSRKRTILSISYDSSLARTREMLLVAAGFQVATFTESELAIQACQRQSFDLVLIGHSIPLSERKRLLDRVRALCQAPVLALLRYSESPLPGADYVFDASQSPVQLLETVMNILSADSN
jgi:DNA-binding NtrC family response regulator